MLAYGKCSCSCCVIISLSYRRVKSCVPERRVMGSSSAINMIGPGRSVVPLLPQTLPKFLEDQIAVLQPHHTLPSRLCRQLYSLCNFFYIISKAFPLSELGLLDLTFRSTLVAETFGKTHDLFVCCWFVKAIERLLDCVPFSA
jgi:hypothetical protein